VCVLTPIHTNIPDCAVKRQCLHNNLMSVTRTAKKKGEISPKKARLCPVRARGFSVYDAEAEKDSAGKRGGGEKTQIKFIQGSGVSHILYDGSQLLSPIEVGTAPRRDARRIDSITFTTVSQRRALASSFELFENATRHKQI
jgi:hypothetical protein